ncbi:GGDEF domain-containing protein [Aestuariibacter halophilus]|uniref:diguanylate cyclase n=1 Tax=Fluctibacter halophilus TaxID=226011 RepID=A0ABS8GC84_9ALTE|nr:GGDEF domain-containing protein [Aestuariibacter halophilus]MCC2618182.1 GGDEF domain-containing protein [Aestuariibacter halophilus]
MEQSVTTTLHATPYFSLSNHVCGLSQQDSYLLLQDLVADLDVDVLAQTFAKHVRAHLPLAALRITLDEHTITIGDAALSCNIKSFEITHLQHHVGTVDFGFSRLLSDRELVVLADLQRYLRAPLQHAREIHRLKTMAMRDHLTGLGNRALYEDTLHRLVCQSKRTHEGFGILVIDLDRFKQVNDSHGHDEGDRVLVAIADVLNNALRETDYSFRFGGDEFCCLLPGSSKEENQLIAQRIQHAVEQHPLLTQHGVSCSIGSAAYQQQDNERGLFSRADLALYEAKNAGRNCIKAA